jgi:DNA processing protein
VTEFLEDKKIWTALMSVEGIGPGAFWRIKRHLKRLEVTWGEFWFSHSQRLWKECGLYEHQQSAALVFQKMYTPESYYGWLKEQDISVITYLEKKYPKLLKNIDDKPILLFIKGKKKGWNQLPIGVVGTRKVSAYGRVATHKIVRELVIEGATIASGFMYGIDVQAHLAALEHGGYTVGVLGYGFNYVYPAENKPLFEEIIANGGSFISEYAPHVAPNKGTFVARNRIIAGMSLGTVVIEAGIKSGSHITVEDALDYGRSVFAVPGPITNPYSEGTKWLINQGATLVSSGGEIISSLGTKQLGQHMEPKKLQFSDSFHHQLYVLLNEKPTTVDELADQLQQPAAAVQTALSTMELDGYIVRTGAVWMIQ